MAGSSGTDFMKIRRYVIDAIATSGVQPVRFPSTHKLSKMFEVSQPTVLRVVRDLIAEGHLEPLPGGGTISRPLTFMPASQAVRIFGYCFALGKQSFISFYYIQLLTAVARELTRRNLCYNVQDIQLESPSMLRAAASEAQLSGLILLAADPALAEHARKLHRKGLPVVSFTRESEGISSVYMSEEALSREVLLQMFAEGRRRILIASWPEEFFVAPIRRGIDAACSAAGVSPQQVLLLSGNFVENRAKVEEMLAFGMEFDGVIFYHFNHQLYEAIARKLDIREKCRLVCDEYALPGSVGFTGQVINYHLEEGAKILVDNLLQQVEDPAGTPVIRETIGYDLTFYSEGKPVES